MTVHGLDRPAVEDPGRRTRRGRLQMLMVLLICASPVIASYFMYFVVRPEGRTNYGTLVTPGRAMPDLQGIDLNGQPVAAKALKNQWLLIVVAPSRCDAACEKRLFMQRQLREMLGRERDRLEKVWLVSDDGPVAPGLRAAVQASPAVVAMRVDAKALGTWLEADAGRTLEDHLYVVDPMGLWMMRFPPDPDPQRVKRDLERLLRASSSWDQAGGR